MSKDPIKDALRLMPYGFYGITSRDGDEVNAMVANWVSQASFSPRLITFNLQNDSYSYGVISAGRVFAINIFHKDNEDAMMPFTKSHSKRPDKMENASYEPAPETGCPILAGAIAYVECRVTAILDIGGDHNIVVGEVVGGAVRQETADADVMSLVHIGWHYAG